jgi:hypothetical protein
VGVKDRVAHLERCVGQPLRRSPAEELEREAKIAELRHLYGTVRDVAQREVDEGRPQRLRALQELNEQVQKRRRAQEE